MSRRAEQPVTQVVSRPIQRPGLGNSEQDQCLTRRRTPRIRESSPMPHRPLIERQTLAEAELAGLFFG